MFKFQMPEKEENKGKKEEKKQKKRGGRSIEREREKNGFTPSCLKKSKEEAVFFVPIKIICHYLFRAQSPTPNYVDDDNELHRNVVYAAMATISI